MDDKLRMQTIQTITIGHLNIVDHLILGIAASPSGQDGVSDITLHQVSLNAWGPVCQGLTSGELDAALMTIPLAMDLFGAGLDIALVMFSHRGGSLLASRTDMARLADFKGRSLLIPHHLSIQGMLMHKLMADRGMTLSFTSHASDDAVRAETIPTHLMMEMVRNDLDDDIAGFISPDPFVSHAASQGQMKALLTSQALWKDHPCCGLVVRRQLLEDPDAVGYLVTTLFRAAADLNRELLAPEGPGPEIIDAAAMFLDQNPECAARALTRSGVIYSPDLLVPGMGPLTTVLDYMRSTMGLTTLPADLNEFVQPQFAQNALAELNP